MMKNLLLTLFTVLLASASFSQVAVDLEAELISPTTDTVEGGTGYGFTLKINNVGTVSIAGGDTVYYNVVRDGSVVFQGGVELGAAGIAAGSDVTLNPRSFSTATIPTTQTYSQICVVVIPNPNTGVDTAASTIANNVDCFIWNRSLVGVDELSINEEVTISNAYGVINLNATNQENYTYSVYSVSGQIISQGTFVNNKEVDMTGVAKGIYAVVVSNGTEKITKKIAIQ